MNWKGLQKDMIKMLINIIKHPIFMASKRIDLFKYLLHDYINKYGILSDNDKILFNTLKKLGIKKDGVIIVSGVGDGHILYYLLSHKFIKAVGYDMNKKNVKNCNRISGSDISHIINNYNELPKGDVLVCCNLLNGMYIESRKLFLNRISHRYKSFLFYGNNNEVDRKPLGPEPIGTHGCEQYSTISLINELKDFFPDLKIESNGKHYIYYVNK